MVAEGAEEAVGAAEAAPEAAEAAEVAEVSEAAEVAEVAEAGVFRLEVSASAVPDLCWRGAADCTQIAKLPELLGKTVP